MGLDVTAYSNLRKVEFQPDELDENGYPMDDGYEDENGEWITTYSFKCWNHPEFFDRSEGIESAAYYLAEDEAVVMGMSYGGYNTWRRMLSRMVGFGVEDVWDGRVTEGPFVELINFSDCEGVIGPVVCAKLLKDFEENEDMARQYDDERFYKVYLGFLNGLRLACSGTGIGALYFH